MQENERAMALRVYSMAQRADRCNLQVHTAALDACLLTTSVDTVDTSAEDLARGLAIYDTVRASGTDANQMLMRPDAQFMQTLIAVVGRNGSLSAAVALMSDMQVCPLLPLLTPPRLVKILLNLNLDRSQVENLDRS